MLATPLLDLKMNGTTPQTLKSAVVEEASILSSSTQKETQSTTIVSSLAQVTIVEEETLCGTAG